MATNATLGKTSLQIPWHIPSPFLRATGRCSSCSAGPLPQPPFCSGRALRSMTVHSLTSGVCANDCRLCSGAASFACGHPLIREADSRTITNSPLTGFSRSMDRTRRCHHEHFSPKSRPRCSNTRCDWRMSSSRQSMLVMPGGSPSAASIVRTNSPSRQGLTRCSLMPSSVLSTVVGPFMSRLNSIRAPSRSTRMPRTASAPSCEFISRTRTHC